MKTSPTDPFRPDSAGAGETLLVFLDETGSPERWLLVDAVSVTRGDGAPPPAARSVLAVPGAQVTLQWLELAEGLTAAQAAAAARLLLADASAEPLGDMHVAVGRPERGLTPAALVPNARMAAWLGDGADPDLVLPATLLLVPPETGFRRHGDDYRGPAAAFSLELELAETVIGGEPVEAIDEARFEAQLAEVLASPPIDLRQGAFARRRQWRVDPGSARRVAFLALAFLLLTLVVQIAMILSYAFAADRLETEAAALGTPASGAAGQNRPGFAPVAAILFDAIRSTPNAELSRLEYGGDGSLTGAVMADSPASLTALQARLEASGASIQAGNVQSAGGRPVVDLTVRPR